MRTWLLLTGLALKDTFRQVGQLLINIATVGGVGLPLLLLLGLCAGLVTQLEQSLLQSPSARLITVHATGGTAGPLDPATEARLRGHSLVDTIIPDVQRVVAARHGEHGPTLGSLTLLPTQPGDPLLALYHADVIAGPIGGVVLSRAAADKLAIRYGPRTGGGHSVEPGQDVHLQLRREESDDQQLPVSVRLDVKAVADFGEADVAYAHRQLLSWIEDYLQGHAVAELGWPARQQNVVPAYDGYLAFCKQPFSDLDLTKV